ncbi:hypothetical protein P7C70_g9070, partial [Phenoliferia sp. Uapishka_3]
DGDGPVETDPESQVDEGGSHSRSERVNRGGAEASGEESVEEGEVEEGEVPKKRKKRYSQAGKEARKIRKKENRSLQRSLDTVGLLISPTDPFPELTLYLKHLQRSPVYGHANHYGGLFKERFYKSTPEEAGALVGQLHSGERVRHNILGLLVLLDNPSLDVLEIPSEAAIRSANSSDVYGLDPTLFYTIFMDFVARNMTRGPNQSILNNFLRSRRLGQKEVEEFKAIGEMASKVTFLTVLHGEDIGFRARARGKKAWSTFHPAAPTPSDSDLVPPAFIVVHQYLPLRNLATPHRDILLLYDAIQADPELHWLLLRDNSVQLTDEENTALNKSLDLRLDPPGEETDEGRKGASFVIGARFDFSPHPRWRNIRALAMEWTLESARLQRAWRRGKTFKTTGTAGGFGVVNNQRGRVGKYNNTKKVPRTVSDREKLAMLELAETGLSDCLLFLVGSALNGYLTHLQHQTSLAGLAGLGIANVVTTLAWMLGFAALLHWEAKDDPWLSSGLCLGPLDPTAQPGGAYNLVLAAIDNGRGIVIENGEGRGMVWSGDVLHGTSFPWTPYEAPWAPLDNTGRPLSAETLEEGALLRIRGGGGRRARGRGGAAGGPATRTRSIAAAGRNVGVCAWQKSSTLKRAKKRVGERAQKVADLEDDPVIPEGNGDSAVGAELLLQGGLLPGGVAAI